MTAPYECEVRVPVADIAALHGRIAALGGQVRERYAFTDHYYRPAGGRWNPRERALRIREHMSPEADSEILLTHVEIISAEGLSFKRSRFAEGKVRLYAGTLADCRRIVETIGFLPWITVRKRDGTLFTIPGLGEIVTEHVEGLGWMVEVEEEGRDPGAAVGAIRRTLDLLDLPEDQVTPEPVAALAAAAASSATAAPAATNPRVAAAPVASLLRPADTPAGRTVYFCGSIRGGRERQTVYRTIVEHLVARGFGVLTAHVADPDVLARETRGGMTARDIYARDLRWLRECDLVIAEVSTPSLGVGVEIAEAQHLGKPILALTRADVHLSAMVGGNPDVRVVTYDGEGDVPGRLDEALRALPRYAAEDT